MPEVEKKFTLPELEALFQPGSPEEWNNLIVKELKGYPLEKLPTLTRDGFSIQPFYSPDSESEIPFLQEHSWYTFIRNLHPAPMSLLQAPDSLSGETLESDLAPEEITLILKNIRPENADSVTKGYFCLDIRTEPDKAWNQWLAGKQVAATADWPLVQVPLTPDWTVGFSPYCFRGDQWHYQGATDAQVLAFTLHDLWEWMHRWTEAGFSPEAAMNLVHFRFALGPDLFSGMALIRAFRGLYYKLMQAYGISEPAQPLIFASASLSYFSSLDSHNNILRAGTAAFSAMVTGCAAFETWPFSRKEKESFTARLNRNMVRMLREESYLGRTADPAGGAWMLEALTWNLMQAAEKILIDLQEAGASAQNRIGDMLTMAAAQWQEDCAKARLVLIGVNKQVGPDAGKAGLYSTQDLIQEKLIRLAEPFEQLHLQTAGLPGYQIHYLCPESECQPRADFIRQFMAVCGFKTAQQKPGIWILCGKDEDYARPETQDILRELSGTGIVLLAGKVTDSLWESNGITACIHQGADRVAVGRLLISLLTNHSSQS